MARNVMHGGKVSGSAQIRPTMAGPTITRNDAAKFPNKGSYHGKTPANGVEEQSHGAVFTCNETLIPTPSADKPAKVSKVIASHQGGSISIGSHKTAGDLTASQMGDGGPTGRPYPLKKSYEKHGTKDSGRLPKAE